MKYQANGVMAYLNMAWQINNINNQQLNSALAKWLMAWLAAICGSKKYVAYQEGI